jgi:hypothetical protein
MLFCCANVTSVNGGWKNGDELRMKVNWKRPGVFGAAWQQRSGRLCLFNPRITTRGCLAIVNGRMKSAPSSLELSAFSDLNTRPFIRASPRSNLLSNLYPQQLLVYNSSYTHSITYMQNTIKMVIAKYYLFSSFTHPLRCIHVHPAVRIPQA